MAAPPSLLRTIQLKQTHEVAAWRLRRMRNGAILSQEVNIGVSTLEVTEIETLKWAIVATPPTTPVSLHLNQLSVVKWKQSVSNGSKCDGRNDSKNLQGFLFKWKACTFIGEIPLCLYPECRWEVAASHVNVMWRLSHLCLRGNGVFLNMNRFTGCFFNPNLPQRLHGSTSKQLNVPNSWTSPRKHRAEC